MEEKYVCDLCGKVFKFKQLDKHFVKTAEIAAKSTGVIWTGVHVTLDQSGKAWCPRCFKDEQGLRVGGRTVHTGERHPLLNPPNINASFKCKCGKYLSFSCKSVNIFSGLRVQCATCGTITFVPPTIFNHAEYSPEYQGARLTPNYQSLIKSE